MQSRFKLFMLVVTVFWGTRERILAAEQGQESFSYKNYATVLKDYVDDTGMVNYKQLKAHREKLDTFVTTMSKLDPSSYNRWREKEKIAFWLNTYNALTLKVIIDNYPIKPSFFRSRIYPKNSIRQIPGVWDKMTFNVMGKDLTLEHIEHNVLRKKFDEPRIHVAMVCAALSCPPLLNEPYEGRKLDEQLNNRARRFLGNPDKFKINRENRRVYLSPILKWFADDFVNKYGTEEHIGKQSKKTSAILNFTADYLEKSDKDYILAGEFKIKYLKYDWSLNEQSIKSAR